MDQKKVGSVERVRLALEEKGLDSEIERFDQSTRSAADAAAAIGCSVGQIAKSLIFRAKKSERPVLVIARGDGRVKEKKIAPMYSSCRHIWPISHGQMPPLSPGMTPQESDSRNMPAVSHLNLRDQPSFENK